MSEPPQHPWASTGTAHAVALELLLRGPLSRSDLARRLKLSPGSLTRLTKPLLDSGLLVEVGTEPEQRAGRPSIPLDIVTEAHRFVGAKITGDDVHAAVTTLRAEVLDSGAARLRGRSPEAVVATVRDLVADLTEDVPGMVGLGVSLGGQVVDHATVTRAPFLQWTEDVPLRALLEEATGIPTTVDNDLLALTKAEHWFGAARDQDRFAVITTGIGVGYGLVMHDTVVESPDIGHGLVGHYPLDPLGPRCGEGHRGCAAAMLSSKHISAAVSAGLERPVPYDECLDLALTGDPVAAPVIADSGRALGKLIADVATLTMISTFVLTGEGMRLAEVAEDAVREGIRRNRHPEASPLSLTVQSHDPTHWARGAAVTAIQNYVLSGQNGSAVGPS